MTLGRWGRLHEESLRENQPETYRRLQASGELDDYLGERDQEFAQMWIQVQSQVNQEYPLPKGLTYEERLGRMESRAAIARELMYEEVLVPDPETERAMRDGYTD